MEDYIDPNKIIIEKTVEALVNRGISKIINIYDKYHKKLVAQAKTKYNHTDYEYFVNLLNLEISETEVLKSISYNLRTSSNWSNEVTFSHAITSKSLQKIFVDIDLYLSPLKYRFDLEEQTQKISSKNFARNWEKNKIIYGGAGAGKTTLLKKVYLNFSNIKKDYNFSCPIMIRFRELDYDKLIKNNFGLFKILSDTLGIHFNFPRKKKYHEDFGEKYEQMMKQTIIAFLEDCSILLIADGFDEIPNLSVKKNIERDFYELSTALNKSKFILTSRTNDFSMRLSQTDMFEICPLNDEQIKTIISKWITKKEDVANFLRQIKLSPFYDTAMRPLTLSHLCAIYERKRAIPSKPRYVYDFIIELLLERWDQERAIIRPSEYADFYIEKKKEFLAHLSYLLSYQMNINVFSSDDIRKCYKQIHTTHNLPKSQATKIVREIESHTGIFVQTSQNLYQFSHKSLQEFLTAKYICSLSQIPSSSIINKLPNEIAITISLSSCSDSYFIEFNKSFSEYDPEFWKIFLTRLIDEKPDFSNTPSVIIFFLIQIGTNQRSFFKDALLKLFESTNLKQVSKSLFLEYQESQDIGEYLILVSKKLKKQLKDRNYYPSQLYIEKEIYHILKE